jgi:hypothetical protein
MTDGPALLRPLKCRKCGYEATYTPPDDFLPAVNMSTKCPEITARLSRGEDFAGDPRRCNAMFGIWVAAERTRKAPPPPDRSDTH